MTSAVTNNLRKDLLDYLKSSVDGADNYYVGFAKSDDFTPATDISSRAEQLDWACFLTQVQRQVRKHINDKFTMSSASCTSKCFC